MNYGVLVNQVFSDALSSVLLLTTAAVLLVLALVPVLKVLCLGIRSAGLVATVAVLG